MRFLDNSPALTITGPSIFSTALRCSGLRRERKKDNGSMEGWKIGVCLHFSFFTPLNILQR
jgi:hypothetical protein